MKRTNNKFRNNNYNNQIYSLNYKFDSNSIAGKVSGTALDLIKRYNELAKEAHMNNDYVSAEVFRQYAEHYRKIVTEINEKKSQNRIANAQLSADKSSTTTQTLELNNSNSDSQTSTAVEAQQETGKEEQVHLASVTAIETQQASNAAEIIAPTTEAAEKKSFTVIEIPTGEANTLSSSDEKAKPKRTYRRKIAAAE